MAADECEPCAPGQYSNAQGSTQCKVSATSARPAGCAARWLARCCPALAPHAAPASSSLTLLPTPSRPAALPCGHSLGRHGGDLLLLPCWLFVVCWLRRLQPLVRLSQWLPGWPPCACGWFAAHCGCTCATNAEQPSSAALRIAASPAPTHRWPAPLLAHAAQGVTSAPPPPFGEPCKTCLRLRLPLQLCAGDVRGCCDNRALHGLIIHTPCARPRGVQHPPAVPARLLLKHRRRPAVPALVSLFGTSSLQTCTCPC